MSWYMSLQVLDPELDLRTVKVKMWRSGGDVKLFYRKKEVTTAPEEEEEERVEGKGEEEHGRKDNGRPE